MITASYVNYYSAYENNITWNECFSWCREPKKQAKWVIDFNSKFIIKYMDIEIQLYSLHYCWIFFHHFGTKF